MTNENINVTTDNTQGNDLSAEMRTYYEKRLIDIAGPKLVHDRFGDFYPVPKNGGKTVQFRKYSPLPKASKPLTEGVTPDGRALNVTAVTCDLEQYGDWIGLSDMLDLTAIDNNVVQATRLLGNQAGRTLDSVTREVLAGGTNVRYAPNGTTEVTSRADITADCKITPEIIFRAAADLQAMNADPVDDSYVAIIHPYAAFDLMRNSEWIDVNKYANADNIYAGEIGKLGGVRFVSTPEAKVIGPATVADGISRLTVKTAVNSSTTSVAVNETLSAATFDEPIPVYVNGQPNTITAITVAGGTSSVTLGTAISSLAKGALICGAGAGKDGSAVFCTLVLGAHAYGTTEIEGGGLRHIVKQLGYGDDPLDQRASCGWKATKAAKRLVEAYMVRIESGSAYSDMAESN